MQVLEAGLSRLVRNFKVPLINHVLENFDLAGSPTSCRKEPAIVEFLNGHGQG